MIGRARWWAAALAVIAASPTLAAPPPGVTIVAAENMYGDVAAQIAGPDARVTSIISKPDADPHLFEASPAVARALADANIVIRNGLGYDPWMQRLLSGARVGSRQVITVSDLLHRAAGGNPHLWYDPTTMPALARALAAALDRAEPARAADHARNLAAFLASLQPIEARVAAMRKRYTGQAVTATEPVFGLMTGALGLVMRNERFQLAVMNDTEPAASDIAAFERDLTGRRVRVLLFNAQASNAASRRLEAVARRAGVPVVGVSETEPAGVTYQDWVTRELDALDAALAGPPQ